MNQDSGQDRIPVGWGSGVCGEKPGRERVSCGCMWDIFVFLMCELGQHGLGTLLYLGCTADKEVLKEKGKHPATHRRRIYLCENDLLCPALACCVQQCSPTAGRVSREEEQAVLGRGGGVQRQQRMQ